MYGFCLLNNKYDSLQFRVVLDLDDEEKKAGDEEEGSTITKVIKLKYNRIKDDFLVYIRMCLMQKFKKDKPLY